MARHIDACKFAEKAYAVAYPIVYDNNSHERGLSLMGLAQLLDEQPEVDLVEVVRCKDCENYRLDRPVSPAVVGDDDSFHFCCAHERYLFVNDYCSYGVRKDG